MMNNGMVILTRSDLIDCDVIDGVKLKEEPPPKIRSSILDPSSYGEDKVKAHWLPREHLPTLSCCQKIYRKELMIWTLMNLQKRIAERLIDVRMKRVLNFKDGRSRKRI
jgi:hypothetical protein